MEELLTKIVEERSLDPENLEIQIEMDDDQGLFKVMMSVKENKESGDGSKRSKYSECYTATYFKLSSVKRIFILAVVSSSESYSSVYYILKLLNLSSVEFCYSMYLKMMLIMCGNNQHHLNTVVHFVMVVVLGHQKLHQQQWDHSGPVMKHMLKMVRSKVTQSHLQGSQLCGGAFKLHKSGVSGAK